MCGWSTRPSQSPGEQRGSDVEVELDTEPREVTLPPDFAAALDADAAARALFDGLSYSNKLRHVLSIEDAKTDETRRRRIDKLVSGLREDRKWPSSGLGPLVARSDQPHEHLVAASTRPPSYPLALFAGHAPVAQWIEQPPSKRLVAGSIPAGGADPSAQLVGWSFTRCISQSEFVRINA